jgi:hypothetical protein
MDSARAVWRGHKVKIIQAAFERGEVNIGAERPGRKWRSSGGGGGVVYCGSGGDMRHLYVGSTEHCGADVPTALYGSLAIIDIIHHMRYIQFKSHIHNHIHIFRSTPLMPPNTPLVSCLVPRPCVTQTTSSCTFTATAQIGR